jgi:hypothetical protein
MHTDDSDGKTERMRMRLDDTAGLAGLVRRIQEENPEGGNNFVIVVGNPNANYFIQLLSAAGLDRVHAEAVSNEFIGWIEDELDDGQVLHLEGLGWLPPDSRCPNFYREWTALTDQDRQDIARHVIKTFQEVYGVGPTEEVEMTLCFD